MEFCFRGLMAPAFTPFKDNYELDLGKIPRYSELLKENGIMGVLVNGTTGEGMSMTREERISVVEAWVKARQNIPGLKLLIQIGGAALPDVKKMAQHAEFCKVDGILCLPDLFFRPTSVKDLIRYMNSVAESAPNTPLLYYHIPSLTGVNLDMGEFLEEGKKEIPTLAGIKFTHNDLEQGARCLSAREVPFSVFLGADQILAGACALGFDSAIAISLNMFASHLRGIMDHMGRGNVKEALELQKSLSHKIADISKHGFLVSSMKTAMEVITGLDLGPVRPPLVKLTQAQRKEIESSFYFSSSKNQKI